MKKTLLMMGLAGVLSFGLAACNNTQPEETTNFTQEKTTHYSTFEETTTIENIEDNTESTITNLDQEDTQSVGNGDINTVVGAYINLSEVTDYKYEAGGIEVVSGESVIEEGKSTIKAVKSGTSVIKCDLMDVQTGEITQKSFTIVVNE